MAYSYDPKTSSIIINGFEQGIGTSPYEGFTDMRNAEIIQEEGEISVCFASGAVTLPPVMNLEAFTASASTDRLTISDASELYEGCAIAINSTTASGISAGSTTAQTISYVVVGGGGAGGSAGSNETNRHAAGGGGGGGEVKSGTTTLGIGTVTITVGAGGTPDGVSIPPVNGGNGGSSVLGAIATSVGGAGGGSAKGSASTSTANAGTNSLGGNGGAGGGSGVSSSFGNTSSAGGTGTYAGGVGQAGSVTSGGGGSSTAETGDGAAGSNGGNGADGVLVSINGYSAYLGGGGGGGSSNSGGAPATVASGGLGGGGNGAIDNNGSNTSPTNATANTGGGGGGGASESSGGQSGGAGGSGVVVVSYVTGTVVATGGTITTNGIYTIHTFTSSGTLTVTAVGSMSCYYVRNLSGNTFQLSEYPNSSIVDITSDGSGTFTTYQYGNQRGLTDNGAPVSYFNAPEIGGVLLLDSSNYAWLWQQGEDGASPINTLLFLRSGNVTGAGSSIDNQTGIAYWNKNIVVVQQPVTVDVLNWETFTSIQPTSSWDYTSIKANETVIAQLSFDTAIASVGTFYIFEPAGSEMPVTKGTDRVFASSSSTTVTSNTISVEAGETIFAVVATYNNSAISGATFNGNAMTAEVTDSGASPFNYGYTLFSYTASTAMSGTVVGTYAGAVTNRLVSSFHVQGMSTAVKTGQSNTETSQNYFLSTLTRDKPNQTGVFFVMTTNTTDLEETISSGLVVQQDQISSAGHDWLYFYGAGNGSSVTLKRNVPITVAENNTLYWGAGNQYLASLNQNAGEIFSPSNPDSFTLSWQAFDVPEGEIIESVEMASGTLYIGSDSKKIYPWDTISPSFDFPISFPEPAVVDFVSSNNLLYTFAGNQGRIYLTNNSSATLYRELPGSITGIERPFFFFWDANAGNNELYFTFQAFANDDPDIAVAGTTGVWAINSDTGALRMVQSSLQADAWVRMVNPVADGFTQDYLRPPGQGLLVGYSVGSDYYLGYSISTPHTTYQTFFESEIIPVGSFFDKHTFEHLEYKLGVPMVAGEGIRVSQRSNLNSTYTQIAEFTTAGLISDQASINWENVEWLQFKVEMKSVSINPSYVRLRELRIR